MDDSGGDVLLSYRIYDDNAVFKGLGGQTGGIDTGKTPLNADGSITVEANTLSNLDFTFNKDYSGTFDIEFQVVETLNNRFVSSDTPLADRKITVIIEPTSDTPNLTVANVEGVEDVFIPISISSSSADESNPETITVYVEKPSQVVKFINTTTNVEVGTSTTFDFGDVDGLVDNETLDAAGNFTIDGALSALLPMINYSVQISSKDDNSSCNIYYYWN